jgi:AAHS family 4-hydroxybenzoate transporter-like MFS transporter
MTHLADRGRPAAGAVDIGRLLDEGQWGGYQRVLVLLAALAVVFDGADIQLLAIALPAIGREWGVQRSTFAPILAIGLVGMMIGGSVAGMIGDWLGRRRALIGSVLLFGVMTLAMSVVGGLNGLAALRALAGLGLGGAIPNAAALASEFVPRRHRSFAVTLTIVCVPVGAALAGLVAIRVVPALGWRALFAIGGLAPIAVALILMAMLPESPRYLARQRTRWHELAKNLRRMGHDAPPGVAFVDLTERPVARGSLAELFARDSRRDTLALWAAFFSCLLAVYLGFNWVPSLLSSAGMSPAVGGAGITVFNLGGVAGAVGATLAFPRLGSRLTMSAMAGGAVIGAIALSLVPIGPGSAVAPIIVLLGATGGLINAVQTTMYALAAHVYPTGVRATGVGAASAIGRGGAIASTYAGAWALERGGAAFFFTLVAAAMLMALLSLALVTRHIPGVRGSGAGMAQSRLRWRRHG